MSIFSAIDTNFFSLISLPLFIFIARIFDVSLGTMRIIFISRGNKLSAAFLGFFEVLIWLIAISQVIQNLNSIAFYLAYAGGFAAGTFAGMLIEEKLAIGIFIVRIFLVEDECILKERLSASGYGVTVVDARGVNGNVKLVYTIVRRKNINNVVEIINTCYPKVFYSIEDARTAREGVFPSKTNSFLKNRLFSVK